MTGRLQSVGPMIGRATPGQPWFRPTVSGRDSSRVARVRPGRATGRQRADVRRTWGPVARRKAALGCRPGARAAVSPGRRSPSSVLSPSMGDTNVSGQSMDPAKIAEAVSAFLDLPRVRRELEVTLARRYERVDVFFRRATV